MGDRARYRVTIKWQKDGAGSGSFQVTKWAESPEHACKKAMAGVDKEYIIVKATAERIKE